MIIQTNNDSFNKEAAKYKEMFGKDHEGILTLYDKDLLKVDPHNLDDCNDPDFKLRGRVIKECESNVWYFFREVVRITTPMGGVVPFNLNIGSFLAIHHFDHNIPAMIISPRQTGRSYVLNCLSMWCQLFSTVAEHSSIVTLSDGNRRYTFNTIKKLLSNLPDYLPITSNMPRVKYVYSTVEENKRWLQWDRSLAISTDDLTTTPHIEPLINTLKEREKTSKHLLNYPAKRLRLHVGTKPASTCSSYDFIRNLRGTRLDITKPWPTTRNSDMSFISLSHLELGMSHDWLVHMSNHYNCSREGMKSLFNIWDDNEL